MKQKVFPNNVKILENPKNTPTSPTLLLIYYILVIYM